ncbi:MAG: hypothetical protein IPL39_16615 [Opitutaceae bacterium]|nr:hypothetical protein [Opitutaceae bacterium]
MPPLPEGQAGKAVARLLPYLAEPFFAPLSAFMEEGQLSKRRLGMLERYRTAKQQVVESLCAEIGSAQDATSAERRERLVALAQRQAAAVAQVERLAEEIRQNLCKTTLLEDGVDWEETRNWHLGDANRELPGQDRFVVLQAAAAFAAEFSGEQRGLLQEAATEALGPGPAAADSSASPLSETYVHFTPSTSRIRLPAEMPAALQGRVAAYHELKGALKDELCAAVFGNDKSKDRERAATFQALREAQAARIVRLQSLAEEIRVGLVGSVYPDEPPTSLIPPSLAPQIADYLKAKVETQRAFVAKLAEVRAAVPQGQAEIVPYARGYQIQVSGSAVSANADVTVLNSLPEFHETQARRYTGLVAQKKALVQALTEGPGRPLEAADRSVDALLQEFSLAQAQRETWNKYWAYRQAVLEPGLSDGQRRLLFSSAVESLVGPYIR